MATNPDVYLLYEYMKKNAFTVRIKANMTEAVDESLLKEAAVEAMTRFPYFSVRVGLDDDENYILLPNDRPVPVLPETDDRLLLGSERVRGHLFAITWKGNSIWFNFAHCICGGFGAMYWVKTTLYQYLTKKYGEIKAPADLKAVGTPVDEAEYAYPDVDALPMNDPLKRYEEKSSKVGMQQDVNYFINPFVNEIYYYELELDSKPFMDYAKKIDGTPNTVLSALLMKTAADYFPRVEGWHISGKVADDYRKDVGCDKSYRDFVRFIHVKYDWEMKDESIERLSQRARGAILTQMQPENSFEWFRKQVEVHNGVDAQPDLKSKTKYAKKHSLYINDTRDTFMVSYVGRTDWGGIADYMDSIYTITDGNLMLEVNAVPDKLCVTFQLLTKDKKPLDLFCKVLKEEKLPYKVSERMVRCMPDLILPTMQSR